MPRCGEWDGGGECTALATMSLLRGREIFVAYDLDTAGRAGAAKFAAAATRAAGATVHVLDLARVEASMAPGTTCPTTCSAAGR